MAGLVATCGHWLLLLLVLCTPDDAATLSLPFQTRDLLPVGPHPGGGETRGSHPPEADFLPTTSSFSGSLHALSRLALVVQSLQEEWEYFGVGGAGGGRGRWTNRQTRPHTYNMKKKRQGFFGIDNADFVLRTFELKNAVKTAIPLAVTTDDRMVARVGFINPVRMRNRHRQRVRTGPFRLLPGSRLRMSVDTTIEELRRLMEKQGR